VDNKLWILFLAFLFDRSILTLDGAKVIGTSIYFERMQIKMKLAF